METVINTKTESNDLFDNLLNSIGVQKNGSNPWDIVIHNPNLFDRILREGSLGVGESYMDQWWDCDRLDILFERILRKNFDAQMKISLRTKIQVLLAKIFNTQSKSRSKIVAQKHYDLGNDLFQKMLDSQMIYSCGYWKEATNLEDAQNAKLDLICKKLQLKKGQRLLDIGCGWGGLARYAAKNYEVEVTGITISKQQYDYAKNYCKDFPVSIQLKDYRDITEKFDRIVSVGMFEHVGHKNYLNFMRIVHNALKDNGLFLLHSIGANTVTEMGNEWLTKYIFPNSALPSMELISTAAKNYFVMEDWHNFGAYYDPTLMAWYQNFNASWPELSKKYDNRFYRMWRFYLLSCAGSFRARGNQLWQIVYSKQGVTGGYIAPR